MKKRRSLLIIQFSVLIIFSTNLSAQDTDNPENPGNPAIIGKKFHLTFNNLLNGDEISTFTTFETGGSREKRIGTLIVFWSINCLPCLREIPELNELYNQWKPQGLEIIGIPQDQRPEQVITLCQRFSINWPQFMESGPPFQKPVTAAWHISRTPDFLLLDSYGVVIDYGFYNPVEAVERHFR